MHCVVAGAGYVGVTTALVLVERGHVVSLVDIDEARAQRIAGGEVPFVEPGVDAALKNALKTGRLGTGTDLAAAASQAEAVFLCVGTPSLPKGDADLSFVKSASRMVGQGLRKSGRAPLIVTKSTVPPGTTAGLVAKEVAAASHKKEGQGFHVASNPEFLREGRALEDARTPDRVVVGALRPETADAVVSLWGYVGVPVVSTDPTTAELIKYASNAFLATKISFANELANLCAAVGVDVYDVVRGMGLDKRIGAEFLRAGAGFGGSCFPKDVRALDRFGKKSGSPLKLPKAVLEINDRQPLEVVKLLEANLGSLKGKAVALLGLAFKPDTDDVRETRALPIYQALAKAGANVTVWDPAAVTNFKRLAGGAIDAASDLRAALRGKSAVVIQTEWQELRQVPAAEWRHLMSGALVVDGRRSVDAGAFQAAGLHYVAIGMPAK